MSLFAGILPGAADKGISSSLFTSSNKYRRGDLPASIPPQGKRHQDGTISAAAEAGTSGTDHRTGQAGTAKKQKNSREQPASEPQKKKQKRHASQVEAPASAGVDGLSPAGEEKPRRKKKKQASAIDAPEEQTETAARQSASGQSDSPNGEKKKKKKEKKVRSEELTSDVLKKKRAKKRAAPGSEPDSELPPAVAEGKKAKKRKKAKPAADSEAELEQILAKEGLGLEAASEEQPVAGKGPGVQDAEADEAGEPAQVRRTPQEEAARLQQTIFVGNLPAAVKRKRLLEIFSKYGAVDSIRLRSVPVKLDKKLPRRAAILGGHISSDRGTANAYIVFKDAATVSAALAHNMQEVDGLHVRVDRAAKVSKDGAKGSVEYDRTSSVFVGNLPFDVEDEEVIRVFNDVGAEAGASSVAAVRVVRDPETNLGKGFAFVLFTGKNAARMALARDGTKLRKRPIRVTRVAVPGRGAAAHSSRAEGSAKGPERTSQLGRILQEQGAERRISGSGGKPSASPSYGAIQGRKPSAPMGTWQGHRTKGAGKFVHSAAAAAPRREPRAQGGATGRGRIQAGSGKVAKKREAKRPAVAARKARALGLPEPAKPDKKALEKKRKYSLKG